MDMDDYIRKHKILSSLKHNLNGLLKEKEKLLENLQRVEVQIKKHEDYIKVLEKES